MAAVFDNRQELALLPWYHSKHCVTQQSELSAWWLKGDMIEYVCGKLLLGLAVSAGDGRKQSRLKTVYAAVAKP